MTDVLVTGTFNVLHAGHVELLEFASQHGSVTVGINSDAYLHGKYGEDKTVPMLNRAYVLQALRCVDEVVIFTQDDPSELIRQLRPRIFVRGPDYAGVELPEQDALDDIGAQLVVHCAEKIQNASTLVGIVSPSAFASVGTGAVLSRIPRY